MSPGGRPRWRRQSRTKWEWLAKPRRCATAESDALAPGSASSSIARRRRSSVRYSCNVRPVCARKIRQRWNTDVPAARARLAADQFGLGEFDDLQAPPPRLCAAGQRLRGALVRHGEDASHDADHRLFRLERIHRARAGALGKAPLREVEIRRARRPLEREWSAVVLRGPRIEGSRDVTRRMVGQRKPVAPVSVGGKRRALVALCAIVDGDDVRVGHERPRSFVTDPDARAREDDDAPLDGPRIAEGRVTHGTAEGADGGHRALEQHGINRGGIRATRAMA